MIKTIEDFKWWVPINNASEYERVLFMCQVFGIVAFEHLGRCPPESREYDTRYSGFGSTRPYPTVPYDDYHVISCNKVEIYEGAMLFDDLDSLYNHLEELVQSSKLVN